MTENEIAKRIVDATYQTIPSDQASSNRSMKLCSFTNYKGAVLWSSDNSRSLSCKMESRWTTGLEPTLLLKAK